MNRIQFFVLTGLSSLIVLLLIGHIFLVRQTNFEQNRLAAAQQVINQGQAFQGNLKQLAVRIFQDSQKTQDPGLKDLLTRQQITYTAPTESTNSTESPASPTPSTPSSTH
jgi:competence protein ComGC